MVGCREVEFPQVAESYPSSSRFPFDAAGRPPPDHSEKKSYSKVAQAVIKALTDGYSRTGGHTERLKEARETLSGGRIVC